MPIKPFTQLFSSWGGSEDLSVADLRLKAITLLALGIMLRPSDIAPRGVLFDPQSESAEQLVFSTEDIRRKEDGSMTISFLGIKNDMDRQGFSVHLQPAEQSNMDPVHTLDTYINKTSLQRAQADGSPVFISLVKPSRKLASSGIAQVLNKAIKLAGLEGQGYSAKSFRPTGATTAIANNYDPDTVMKIGKWKTREVFMGHYVHSQTPSSFTTSMFNQV
jgi:hypothetical protein